jgi:hypothetical protein
MLIPKKFASLVCFVLGLAVLTVAFSFSAASRNVYISIDELIQDLDGNWENAFEYVRNQVQFEPSPYFLKSSQGVLWGSRGNAKEQAILLIDILQGLGKDVRLVSGRLDDTKAALLINSVFPQDEESGFSYTSDVPLSEPSQDRDLLSSVKDHYWVQIQEDGKWLDLDPVFPDSVPGQVFAQRIQVYPDTSEDFFPDMVISMSVEKDSEREDVLKVEEKLQNLVNQPVTLSVSSRFQESEEKGQSGGGSPGGVFGSLSRSTSGKKKTEGLEVIYKAKLKIGKGTEVSGEFREKIPESQKNASAQDSIKRVWLNFRLIQDGKIILESERILFEKIRVTDEFPLFQRYSILVSANKIPIEAWEDKLGKVTDDHLLDEVKSSLDEIKASVKTKKDKKILLDKSLALEEKIGPDLGHLVNMIFAYTSDSITEDAGDSLAVYSFFALPRIIIHSVEGDGESVMPAIDLRHDCISAVSYPGQAAAMEETFLYGRGVFESVLEGKVLELFLRKKPLTTAWIMQEATKRRIPIRFYSQLEKDELGILGMPDHVEKRALKAVASGSILIVPERSVRFEGEDRWGWWEIDPSTRAAVGVLDTGLHQAMLQRTVLDTEGMMNSKMGFAIGAITGAVDTQWMLAGMVLRYGDLNKQALQEIKAYMKQIKTYMCPEFEKSASVNIASVTLIDIEDCYKKEFSWGYEGRVKIEMGWCQAFAKGFGCASTSILNHYLSQYE